MKAPAIIRQRPVPDTVPELASEGLHPVLQRVLCARGVRSAEELRLGLADLLRPDTLGGIDTAAELLARAVVEGQRILIVGDFDADGATGTAVAVLALRAMGAAHVDFRVPNRFEFGYGLTPALVETLAGDPPDLLVTVDSGIGCVAGVGRARELGSRVIVTDHHLPGETLPPADAIVNPNCAGDDFGSKALAGVGVMFYLAGRTRQALRDAGWFGGGRREPNLASLLDLVALGTVADLVPLDHNNRVLVRQGLERIRRGLARPGLMALLRAGKRDYRFASAADLGFAVGPRLNAAGRLEDMSVGIRCLLSEDRDQADRMAAQLDELNRQRRDMQEQMQIEAMSQVGELTESLRAEASLPDALCLFDEDWHQGVVGLVASRVKDAVHRPVVAFAPEEPGSDWLKGSARSVRGLHIRDALALLEAREPGLMRAFGGHAMAAGLSLAREHLERFRGGLDSAVRELLGDGSLEAEILTDGSLEPDDLGLELARELERAGPWGQRFPEPLFDGHFAVVDHRVVGGAHLKMQVRAPGAREVVDAIAFNHLPEDLPGSGTARLLYRLDINRWRGSETCQLRVERIVSMGSE
ncbi:single-stranded-DNA-specific exonuclease RecJ [Elongatibacter sediminis]|uniref:Single-stranded-DNA-specific exonuclease RecJ n=1 Tax=Elongatibacter sediminis TaxID=3119006 RepID=A0AAW9RH29_9GAMM